MSFVYAMCDGRAVKFGMAANPKARLAELQVGSPSDLGFAFVIECSDRGAARALERMFHAHLVSERVRGEWFWGPKTFRLTQWPSRFLSHEDAVAEFPDACRSFSQQMAERILPPIASAITSAGERAAVSQAKSSNALRQAKWREANRDKHRTLERERMRLKRSKA